MISPALPAAIAGIIIIPTLIAGSYCDYTQRIFPKTLWGTSGKIAGFFTFMMYLLMAANREWNNIAAFILISAILSIVFYIITLRYGSGGDYRTLIYIACIMPMLAVWTTIYALGIGILQVIAAHFRHTTAPWAIGITIAYIIAYINFFASYL